MIDIYISDSALQILSQLLALSVVLSIMYAYIVEKKKLFVIVGLIYILFSLILIYDIPENIILTVMFCVFSLLMNRCKNWAIICSITIGYLLVNNISLLIITDQETLFYMMLKLMTLDVAVFVFQFYVSLKNHENRKNYLFFQILVFLFCFGTSFLLIVNNRYMKLGMRDILYFPVFANSVLYIVVSALFYFIIRSQKVQENLKLYNLKNKMINKQYYNLKQKYEDISILKHDTKHHLQTLAILLHQKKYEKALAYIDGFSDYINESSLAFGSTNQILEIIINEKYLEARRQGIDILLNCEEIDLEFVEEVDIITIFANILDNAMEAAIVSEDEKKIVVTLVKRNHYIVFEVMNTYGHQVRKKGNRLQTTKKGHDGLGLISINKAVERYRGIVQTDYNDNTFTMTIFFPVKE